MTKTEQMYALVAGRSATGQTVANYCAEHEISVAKYYYWHTRWRESQAKAPAAFVPIMPLDSSTMTIRLEGGLVLNFSAVSLSDVANLLLEMDRRHAQF